MENGHEEESQTRLLEDEQHDSAAAHYSKKAVFLIFLFPAIASLLFGYDIGATSAVLTQLQSATSGVDWGSDIKNSSLLQGLITSTAIVGAIVGSIVCFSLEKLLGRRRELLISAVLYCIGAVIEYLSGLIQAGAIAIPILIFGRIIYGCGAGFAMHAAPCYIGEQSPASIRGTLVGMKEAFIVLGILLGYVVGYLTENTTGGWRICYIIAVGPAIVQVRLPTLLVCRACELLPDLMCLCVLLYCCHLQFIGMYFLPPSARWLMLVGRIEEARIVLEYVTPDITEEQLRDIEVC
jgi:MFS family permease